MISMDFNRWKTTDRVVESSKCRTWYEIEAKSQGYKVQKSRTAWGINEYDEICSTKRLDKAFKKVVHDGKYNLDSFEYKLMKKYKSTIFFLR